MLQKVPWKKKKKLFSAWQIELTTRCPLLCKMCIRSERDDWQNHVMPLEDFKKLLPYLKEVETVVLEGWGESLLHPDLLECIQLAKKEGPEVGFVTSGKGLTQKRISELILAGPDFVGFSIAGITAETHDTIRVNSRLSEMIDAIRYLKEEKIRVGRPQPRVHLVFLIVKDNILELPSLPSFAKEMGIEEVVLINICHTINPWQEQQRIFTWDSGANPYENLLKQAETNARKLHIKLWRPSISPADVPVCDENPLKNLYISSHGEVSPCVYLYPPLPSPFKRIFCSKEYWIEKVSFGNVFTEGFSNIWNGERYVHFRDCFMKRQKEFRDLYFSLLDCSHSIELKTDPLPAPPEFCKSCHKIIGV
jgi:MoaA/NifB/PqqE/SkfB family radical SAM enzyme